MKKADTKREEEFHFLCIEKLFITRLSQNMFVNTLRLHNIARKQKQCINLTVFEFPYQKSIEKVKYYLIKSSYLHIM